MTEDNEVSYLTKRDCGAVDARCVFNFMIGMLIGFIIMVDEPIEWVILGLGLLVMIYFERRTKKEIDFFTEVES